MADNPPHGAGEETHGTRKSISATEARRSKKSGGESTAAAGTTVPPPEGSKKRSFNTPVPEIKQGKGPITIADTKAAELAGKVKRYFAQEEAGDKDKSVQKALRRPRKIYENSYRLTPQIPYSRDRAQKILEVTLEEMMHSAHYNADTASDLAVKIAERIRARILTMKFDRYKIVVMTNIGPLNRQGIHIGFRCLMDSERDSYNTATFKNNYAFCTAVIYAIYFE